MNKCFVCKEDCLNEIHITREPKKVFCSLECLNNYENEIEERIKNMPGLRDYVVGLDRLGEDLYYFRLFLGDKQLKRVALSFTYKAFDVIKTKNLTEAMKILRSNLIKGGFQITKKLNDGYEVQSKKLNKEVK